MELPTTKALVERLKEVYEIETDEDLARKLDVPVRTVGRWKAGGGMTYRRTIDFLNRVGWLAVSAERPSLAHLRAAERAAAAPQRASRASRRSQDGQEKAV